MPKGQFDPGHPKSSKDGVESTTRPLGVLAREAFEEKQRKKCLALTSAMLKIDPENKEAQVIQSWVLSDLQRDLEHARSLVRNSRLKHSPSTWERAELILRSILDSTPDNAEAQALLLELETALQMAVPIAPPRELEGSGYFAPRGTSDPAANPPDFPPSGIRIGMGAERRRGTRLILMAVVAIVVVAVIFYFTQNRESLQMSGVGNAADASTGTLEMDIDEGVDVFINDRYAGKAPLAPVALAPGVYKLRYEFNSEDLGEEEVSVVAGEAARNSLNTFFGRVYFFVVPSTGVQMQADGKPVGPVPSYVDLRPGQRLLEFTAAGYQPETVSTSVVAGQTHRVTAILKPAALLPPSQPRATTERGSPSRTDGSPSPPPVVPAASGTLAVSSAVPVEIYSGGRHMGSTPTTLELSPGTHTFEYRYQDLRQTLSHVITSNQTTTAAVTFDVTVQINARPWAQVFVEGVQPRLLGQTPLSDVRVPIGSVLVFRNPGFPEKKYRVSGADGAIQVVFP